MILPHHSVDWKGKIIGKKELEHRHLRRVSHLEMGKPSFASSNDEHDQDAAPKSFFNKHHQQKVSMLPLVFLIFYQVAGGPFGIEDSVKAGGPLLALLGFLLFPFIWSIPEAFITAEMGTMFPENGGYVVWISAAFGPYWGFQQGWWKWFSGVIDNALYPILFLDYLKSAVPAVAGGPVRIIVIIVITAFLTYLNYRGLTIIGWAAVGIGVFSLMPFCVMTILAIPRLQPSNWFILDMGSIDWNTYLNTLFWNLNYWDSISTLAGEVDDPQRTLPKALFFAFLLAVGSYFFPLLSGIGSIEFVRSSWSDGYFSDVATVVGGRWLRLWMTAAAALSQMGMFEAEMSSDSFQLLGMAERGMLPQIFATRSVYGTPTVGILASASGVLLLSWMSFQEIIAAENLLYCFSMFLEFSAFIWLRKNKPEITRPYRIPLGMVGIVMMCIPPSMLLVLVMTFATWKVTLVSLTVTLIGCALYPFLVFTKRKKWFQFTVSPELPMLPTKEISDKSLDKDSSDTELELLSG